jgi:hypothetical protein
MSFDKLETAQRVRDIVARQAKRVVAQEVPRALVGRMVSLDPLALKGMVWFPGDDEPIEVHFFAGTLPAKWQAQTLAGGAPQTSIKGFGSEVVVERLNGILYVTSVLTGGSFSAGDTSMGSSSVYQIPNDGIDQPYSVLRETYLGSVVGSAAGTRQSVEVYIRNPDGAAHRQSVVFGPFLLLGRTFTNAVKGGKLDITVTRVGTDGTPAKGYSLFIGPNINLYADQSRGNNDWWRILPDKGSFMGSNFTPSAIDPNFQLDVKVQPSDPLADGTTAYYFRITSGGSGTSQVWYNFAIEASAGFNRVGGIDVANTFKQWREVDGPEPVGVIGFHNAGNAYQNPSSYQVSDNFGRDPLPSPTGTSWGTLPYGLGTNVPYIWDTAASPTSIEFDDDVTVTTPHSLIPHHHAFFEFASVNSQRVSWLKSDAATYVSALNLDLYVDFALEDMPVTQSTRLGWRVRSDNGNNEINIGAQITPAGDVQLRFVKQVSGTFTDVGSTITVLTGFTTADVGRLRVQVIGNTMRAKAWIAGPWSNEGTEPRAWQKTESIVDASIQDAGRVGLWGFITSGATTPVPTKVYYENARMQLALPDNLTDTSNTRWNSGPWRSGIVRAGADVQRALVHDGQFSFDGTNIKWTGSLWATGIGPNEDILRWGWSGLTCPSSGDFVTLPNNNVSGDPLTAAAAGMPLPEWHAIYTGIPPGVSSGDDSLNPWLFYVRGDKRGQDYELPEWALLVASRGPADAPIRLGTGRILVPRTKVMRSGAITYTTSTHTLIGWDAESEDQYAMHDTASNNSRLIAQVDGRYRIRSQLSFASNTTGGRQGQIRKNAAGSAVGGSLIQHVGVQAAAGGHTSVLLDTETDMLAGDYLEIFGWQSSGGNLGATTGEPYTNATLEYLP